MHFASVWKIAFLALSITWFKGCLFGGSETEGREGGSETEGLYGKLIFESGDPAEGAIVIAKIKTDSAAPSLKQAAAEIFAIDTTNEQGRYSFITLDSGTYTISGSWAESEQADTLRAYLDNIDFDGVLKNVGIDTLVPPGRISLMLSTYPIEGVDCYVPGITPVFKSDSTGECLVNDIPPGTHTLHYGLTGYLTEKVDVEVISNEVSVVSALRLSADPNYAPPTPQNVAADYDTENGAVRISWDSVFVSDLYGYLIYKNENGGGFALIDTVYDVQHLENLFSDMLDTAAINLQFRIQAVDADGNPSINSNTVSVSAMAPNKPGLPTPNSGSAGISLDPTLSWNGVSTINGETPLYEVLIGTDSNALTSITTGLSTTVFTLSNLDPDTDTYWQIIATTSDSAVTGPIWHFHTRSNTPPAIPVLVAPTNNVTVSDTTAFLIWSGADPDAEDSLLNYTVLFGLDSNNMSVLASGLRDSVFAAAIPQNFVRYYWKVQATDGWDTTESPLGSFFASLPALVAHWDFNEGSGNVLGDKSGNGFDGLITGATWTLGAEGNALSFDGNGDYVEISEINAFKLQQYTLIAWIKPQMFQASVNHMIFSNINSPSGTSEGIGFQFREDTLNSGYAPTTIEHWSGLVANVEAIDGRWHQAAFTRDNNTFAIYFDGQLVQTKAEPRMIEYGDIQPNIGAGQNALNVWWPSYFEGEIDEIKMYNYAMNLDSVANNYNTLLPRVEVQTIAHWDFNEGSGNIITDQSGNENHGTIQSATWDSLGGQSVLAFDGVDDFIDLGECLLVKGSCWKIESFTIEVWAHIQSLPVAPEQTRILYLGQNNGIVNLGFRGNNLLATTRHENRQYYDLEFPIDSMIDSLVYIAYSYDYERNYGHLYLNGQMIDSVLVLGDILIPTLPLWDPPYQPSIGNFKGQLTPSMFYNGKINEIKISNIALTYQQIITTYQAGVQ